MQSLKRWAETTMDLVLAAREAYDQRVGTSS
jgi:hypothetical protein